MALKTTDFDKILINAVDEALFSLGESVEQSVYFNIQTKFKVQRTEIPSKLEEFQGALEKIFGSGALNIEILIMKNVYTQIGQPITAENKKELEFVCYMKAAREAFQKK